MDTKREYTAFSIYVICAMRERILIVSDEKRDASMRESLAQQGFSVAVTDDADEGYKQLIESRFELVVVNLSDPLTGPNLIKRIRTNPELRKVHLLTVAEWGTGQSMVALNEGADGLDPGPINGERLAAAVARLIRPNLTMTALASGADRDDD
jgi:DNA-binding response OmpR family regulator